MSNCFGEALALARVGEVCINTNQMVLKFLRKCNQDTSGNLTLLGMSGKGGILNFFVLHVVEGVNTDFNEGKGDISENYDNISRGESCLLKAPVNVSAPVR